MSWKLKPGVVSTMTAQARYTDPNTRSFTGAGVWLGIASFAAAGVVARLAWLGRDRSPRITADRRPAAQLVTGGPRPLAGRPVGEHLREGLESRARNAVRGLEMDAQREAELGDAVDHALVQVDHELALRAGSLAANPLTNSCSSATAALPGS